MKYAFLPVALFLLAGCLKEDELKFPFKSFEPVALNDGWQLSTPSAEHIDSQQLATVYRNAHDDDALWMMRSLLVFRNAKLVGESYMKDPHEYKKQNAIWSCTKQVMGLLTGIALEQGYIDSLDDPVSKYLPDELLAHPDKQNITIRNLLTMQSGIDYSNDGLKGQTDDLLRQLPSNSVEYILARPMSDQPGTVFHYNDGNPHLLSAILQKVTGQPTDEWAKTVLLDKLELNNYYWRRYDDGITFGAFGLSMPPRELAKFGQCVLDNGKWKGETLVNPAWLAQMTTIHASYTDDRAFGFLWWIDTERGIAYMAGQGGQLVFVIPAKNLLVAITSEPNTQGDFVFPLDKALQIVDDIMLACD